MPIDPEKLNQAQQHAAEGRLTDEDREILRQVVRSYRELREAAREPGMTVEELRRRFVGDEESKTGP